MIRNLLASTAIATLIAAGAHAPALAQTMEPTMPAEQAVAPNVIHAEGHLASRIIGQRVYSSPGDDAENIGSVNDLVISADGDIEALVIGVGGFLGLGQKDVAIEYNVAEWVERDGDRYLVVSTNREALDALPEFDTSAYRPLPPDSQVGNTTPATAEDLGLAAAPAADDAAPPSDDLSEAPADDTAAPADDFAAAPADDMDAPADDLAEAPADDMAAPADDLAEAPADDMAAPADDFAEAPADDATAPADDMAEAPADDAAPADDLAEAPADDVTTQTDDTQTSAIDPSTLTDVTAQISADELIGTTVYGANDENVGSISDVVLSEDGNVDAVIIDVGGFLGIGAKSVAVGMDNLAFLSDGDGNTYLYTQFTQEQLEAHPEYDASTFAESRDGQLLVVPAQ